MLVEGSQREARKSARQEATLRLILPRETARKAARLQVRTGASIFLNLLLTNLSGVSNLPNIRWNRMPDQPSPDKVSLSVRVPRTLAQRLKRLAQQRGETVSELLTWLFTKATHDVELTPDDYRQIAADTERALKLQASKGAARKTLDARYKQPPEGQ